MRITEPYIIFLRTLPSGKKVYYYQFRDESGRRHGAKSCGTDNLNAARRLCKRLYNEGKMAQPRGILFKTFADGFFDEDSDWCKWKELNGGKVAPETLRMYVSLLNHQLLPYFGESHISGITTDDVKKWIAWLNERWSPKTSNSAQSVLNIILKNAKEKNLIKEIPSESLAFRKIVKKDRKLLTVEELAEIYRSERWGQDCIRRAFLLCAITGMRIGEVVGLQVEDVESDRLNVRHSLNRTFGLGATKTRVCRYVPIPSSLKLKQFCGKKWVFEQTGTVKPITSDCVYRKLIAVCASLGIDTKSRGITVHSLRNTFISYVRGSVFGSTIDLKLKAVVGHADSSMTDWYTYWTPEMFPEIYELQEELLQKIIGGAA